MLLKILNPMPSLHMTLIESVDHEKNHYTDNCYANVSDHDDFTPTTEWDLM